jgi:ABC-type lipoprotein release transport system permease subunit
MSSTKSDYAAMRRVAKGWLVIFSIVLIVGVLLVGVSFALPRTFGFGGFGGRAGLFGNADLIVTNSSSSSTTGSFFGASSSTLNQSILTKVDNVQGVAAATAELTASGNIEGSTVILTGVDPATFSNVSSTPSVSSGGQFITQEGTRQIVIGSSLASTLGYSVGASLSVEANTTSNVLSSPMSFTIVGITPASSFSSRFSGSFQFNPVYVSLSDLQSLTNQTGLVNRILVRLVDTSQSSAVSSAIDAIPGVQALSPASFRGGSFGSFGGASPFGAISRPTSLRGTLLIAGLVVAPIGGLGTFWGYHKLSVAKRRERLQQRKKGRGKNSPQ